MCCQCIYGSKGWQHITPYRFPLIEFETDVTLTQDCRTGIINSWHYHNLVGAEL